MTITTPRFIFWTVFDKRSKEMVMSYRTGKPELYKTRASAPADIDTECFMVKKVAIHLIA